MNTHETSWRAWPLRPAADPGIGDAIFGLPADPEGSLVHLLGVPFDATTSYRPGTARGPAAIRDASAQVDLLDPDFGRPWRVGIHLHPEARRLRTLNAAARRAALPIIACLGEIGTSRSLKRARERVEAAGDAVNAWLGARVDALLDDGRIVGVIGGDHSVPFAAIQALARRHPGMGILHVDAHADLRAAYEGFRWSHASIMHNVTTRIPEVERIVQVAIRDYCDEEAERIRTSGGRIVAYPADALRDRRFAGEDFRLTADVIVGELPRTVWISFDIDGLDPRLCPHTGTPVPGGLDFDQTSALLSAVVRSGRRIVGFDLCEVAPGPRGDEWDANVGARVLYKLIGATLLSRISGVG